MSNDKWKMIFSLLFNDPNQMRQLLDCAAHGRRVGTLDDLIKLSQAQAANDLFLFLRARNRAPIVLNANRRRGLVLRCLFLRRHTIKVLLLVCRADGQPQMDPSSSTTRQTSRGRRCAD